MSERDEMIETTKKAMRSVGEPLGGGVKRINLDEQAAAIVDALHPELKPTPEPSPKHTPGPWQLSKDNAPLTIFAGNGIPHIAYIARNGLAATFDEQEANARLIVAAPALLAACKEALIFMEMIGNPAPPHPWMQIRDAINKATGKDITP